MFVEESAPMCYGCWPEGNFKNKASFKYTKSENNKKRW